MDCRQALEISGGEGGCEGWSPPLSTATNLSQTVDTFITYSMTVCLIIVFIAHALPMLRFKPRPPLTVTDQPPFSVILAMPLAVSLDIRTIHFNVNVRYGMYIINTHGRHACQIKLKQYMPMYNCTVQCQLGIILSEVLSKRRRAEFQIDKIKRAAMTDVQMLKMYG